MNNKRHKKSPTRTILEILEAAEKQTTEMATDLIFAFDRPSSLFHRLLAINPFISYKKFYPHYDRLKKQKMILVSEKNDKTIIQITEKGKKRLLRYKMNELKIQKPKVWDKKWRIIVFDIPEKRKLAREILREKFYQLGLYRIQDSVWVHPYDISDIIEFLNTIYEIRPFVKLITANSISDDQKIRNRYKLY